MSERIDTGNQFTRDMNMFLPEHLQSQPIKDFKEKIGARAGLIVGEYVSLGYLAPKAQEGAQVFVESELEKLAAVDPRAIEDSFLDIRQMKFSEVVERYDATARDWSELTFDLEEGDSETRAVSGLAIRAMIPAIRDARVHSEEPGLFLSPGETESVEWQRSTNFNIQNYNMLHGSKARASSMDPAAYVFISALRRAEGRTPLDSGDTHTRFSQWKNPNDASYLTIRHGKANIMQIGEIEGLPDDFGGHRLVTTAPSA